MTWLRLAFANLTLSPLTTAVNVLLMSLGTASIVLLLLAGSQIRETMSNDAKGVDLVLGAQGSPVQLILAAVYHADVPPGNIKLTDAQVWAEDPRVKRAVPVSLGDSYAGFRIVGTTPEYVELFDADFAAGEVWDGSMEAVLGAAVAESGILSMGSEFAGAHGLVDGGHTHDAQTYRVVGVLQPTGTVVDRLVLTSLESVWELHDEDAHAHDAQHEVHADKDHPAEHDDHEEAHHHDDDEAEHADDDHHGHDEEEHADDDHHGHDEEKHADDDHHGDDEEHDDHEAAHEHHDENVEVTAMLITYQSPMAATTLPRAINTDGTLQAAAPAMEISRVLQLVGTGISALGAFAWVLIATAALSIFAALYGSLRARRGELAMLRCLGATRSELLLYLVIEGLLMTVLGIALGVLAGHITMELVGIWLANTQGIVVTGFTWVADETLLIVGLLVVGIVSAIVPAVQAYRTDVATTLAEG